MILRPLLATAGLLGLSALVLAQPDPRPPLEAVTTRTVAAPVPASTPSGQVRRTGPQVDPGWLRRTARLAGIPEAALRAYATAQLRSAGDGCEVGWTTMAGIGWVESQHGTLDGRTLHDDGRSTPRVLGPALDGAGPVAAIPATTEGTALHGDPTWEHAVGPMQFLPSTWASWSADGDSDGLVDPLDLDDAALAAARYLCADGGDLTTGTGWSAAVLSYNHDPAYVAAVHDAAMTYAEAVIR